MSKTTEDRQPDYGSFYDRAEIADEIIETLESSENWESMPSWARQSLREIAGKMSRIVNGDPLKADSWHDIAGYSELAESECIDVANEKVSFTDDWGNWILNTSEARPEDPRAANQFTQILVESVNGTEIITLVGGKSRWTFDGYDSDIIRNKFGR